MNKGWILMFVISLITLESKALPTKDGRGVGEKTNDKLLLEGRRLISEAMGKQEKQAMRTVRKIITKMSRFKCRERLFQECSNDADCGCHIKCQITMDKGRCIPMPYLIMKKRA